jgi:stearoyl-CoA desaturase (delta-9 desaturase)
MSTTNNPANSTEDAFAHAPQIWVNIWLFVLTFLGAVIIVPWYGIVHGYSTAAWLSFALLLGANGMSITAGYHRLWAHRTYEAHWSVRLILMLFGAMALENSILAWSSGHRRHHLYIDDNERDPYSARRGFWFSHIGWMLRDYPSGRRDDSNIVDVARDPIAAFQDRHYVPLVLLMNIGLPLALGWLLGDLWGVFLLGGLLRLVVSQHTTFFINSLAHMWGNQPYTDANTARDNGWLAFLTYGEGYHNFHHCYAADYRNGVRWWQWDPTKWLIFALSQVGLARNVRRVSDVRIQYARLEQQFKLLDAKLAHQPQTATAQQLARFRELVSTEYDALKTAFENWRIAFDQRQGSTHGEWKRLTRQTLARMREMHRRLHFIDTQLVPV